METEDIFSLIGAFALPIAVFALMLIFLLPEYQFNDSQFLVNDTNISINSSWIISELNNTGDQDLSTYVQGNMSSETTTTYTPTNGSALSFDGVNDYVDLGTNLYDLGIRRNGTISFWMKPSAGTSTSGAISDFADSGGANYNGFNIRYESTGNVLTFYVYPNDYRIAVNDAGELNTWQHVVGVLDYDFLRLYKNGVEIGNTSLGGDIGDSVATMKVSARGDLVGYQSGPIDEVLIFNRSLNSTEVEQLYNSGVGLYANTSIAPFNDGLVAGYHFDEGSGTTAIDVTGRNNGTLVNGPSWVDGKVPHNIATQVLGAIGLMPWVSATNFISTDFSLQWIGNTLKNPWKTISTLGNSTNRWNVHLNNVTMNGTQGWSGNCVNSSILNGIIVGCND